MKKLLVALFISVSTFASAQEDVQFTIDGTEVKFTAFPLMPGGTGEATYYNITNGVLDYYVVMEYEGKVIEYKHYFCPTDVIDTKSVEYKEYDAGGLFMYMNAKDLEPTISYETYSDGSGNKIEDTSKSIMLIIPDKNVGTKITGEIKKGKI